MNTPRTCVITGAGRGLGLALAEHLAAQGVNLALCARTADQIARAAAEIGAIHGVNVLAQPLDVADAEAVAAFAARAHSELGPIDGLINNAGVLGPVGRVDTLDLPAWRTAFETNVLGVINMIHAIAPLMIDDGRGSIINLLGGGIGGNGVQSFMSAYTTSKGAVAVLTETIAAELAHEGVRINAISPGPLSTDLMKSVLDAGPQVAGDALYDTAVGIYSGGSDSTILTAETSTLVDFLLSQDSTGISGRLLSTRWNPVSQLRSEVAQLKGSAMYTLRRVDGELFGELRAKPQ